MENQKGKMPVKRTRVFYVLETQKQMFVFRSREKAQKKAIAFNELLGVDVQIKKCEQMEIVDVLENSRKKKFLAE